MDLSKYSIKGLNIELSQAILDEDYELAARIRNEILSRDNTKYSMSRDMQIKTIIDRTNFERIHDVMELLNWTWISTHGIPKIEDLREAATKLLIDIWDVEEGHEMVTASTGGFKVERFIFDGVKLLTLSFIIAGCDLEYDEVMNMEEDD